MRIKGATRFGEMKKMIPNITERMLTLQLKELEQDGIITRFATDSRVEYELTEIGKDLIPICKQLHNWGTKHKLLHLNKETTLID